MCMSHETHDLSLYCHLHSPKKWSICIERGAGYDGVVGVSVTVSGRPVFMDILFSLPSCCFLCGIVEHCQVVQACFRDGCFPTATDCDSFIVAVCI